MLGALSAPAVSAGGSADSGAIAYGEQVLGPQKRATSLTALGSELFGDEINTYTGGVAFSQTDLSLPGNNGLTVGVTRRLVVDGNKSPTVPAETSLWRSYPFGEWELDLPHIGGMYSVQSGWVVNTSNPSARCSSPSTYEQYRPKDESVREVFFSSYTFWSGLQLSVPGVGEQQILYRPAGAPLPTPSGTWTALTTNSQWHFSCLPSCGVGKRAKASWRWPRMGQSIGLTGWSAIRIVCCTVRPSA